MDRLFYPGIGLAMASGYFRGAHFRVDAYQTATGRRSDTREYPLRNVPKTEDLGRKARRFRFTAYCVGDNWEIERDALLNACEADGAGTLVHPFHGEHQVLCEDCVVSESRINGVYYCAFELAFVEWGEYDNPSYEQDWGYRVLSQCQDSYAASQGAFAGR